MYFGSQTLATGTSFMWRNTDKLYLVTNWHNLSGVNPVTGKNMSCNGGRPDRIEFSVLSPTISLKHETWERALSDDNGPLWLEHPSLGRKVDVACLPITHGTCTTIMFDQTKKAKFQTSISDEVFILGYPKNIDAGGLPIWKRASLASEPDVDVNGLPMMLADTATSEGMSGSPVISCKHSGLTQDDVFSISATPDRNMLGIYSGRFGVESQFAAQLGIIWKIKVIDEIISGGKRAALV